MPKTFTEAEKAMIREAVNIESQIENLEKSDVVRLAMRYNETMEQRLQYLQELKQLARLGRRLVDIGWEVPKDAED
jgi:hypothetical protein